MFHWKQSIHCYITLDWTFIGYLMAQYLVCVFVDSLYCITTHLYNQLEPWQMSAGGPLPQVNTRQYLNVEVVAETLRKDQPDPRAKSSNHSPQIYRENAALSEWAQLPQVHTCSEEQHCLHLNPYTWKCGQSQKYPMDWKEAKYSSLFRAWKWPQTICATWFWDPTELKIWICSFFKYLFKTHVNNFKQYGEYLCYRAVITVIETVGTCTPVIICCWHLCTPHPRAAFPGETHEIL